MLAPQAAAAAGPGLDAVFNSIDRNHDGVITKEEFEKLMSSPGFAGPIGGVSVTMPANAAISVPNTPMLVPPAAATTVYRSAPAVLTAPAPVVQQSSRFVSAPPPRGVALPSGVQLLTPPPLQQPPVAVRIQQPFVVDKVVDGGTTIVERPVVVKVQAGDPRALYQGGSAAAQAAAASWGGWKTQVNRLHLPPNDTGMSDEKYLEMMSRQGGVKFGFHQGMRDQQSLESFPYHDPAFGCHYRYVYMNDNWDRELQMLEPDQEAPLETLMRKAKAEIKHREEQKRNRRKLEHYEHEALKKLHMDWVQDGYDEAEPPVPFRHSGRFNSTHHPAMVSVDPESEYHGMAYWLS